MDFSLNFILHVRSTILKRQHISLFHFSFFFFVFRHFFPWKHFHSVKLYGKIVEKNFSELNSVPWLQAGFTMQFITTKSCCAVLFLKHNDVNQVFPAFVHFLYSMLLYINATMNKLQKTADPLIYYM